MKNKTILIVAISTFIVLTTGLFLISYSNLKEDDIKTKTCIAKYEITRNQYSKAPKPDTTNFSDLAKTDATKVETPEIIGTYKDLSFSKQSPKEIVEFLLKSQLITTYWHLKSDICLAKETDTQEKYIADFDASHYYCTNKCITAKYNFSISIDKKNGTITLLPSAK